MANTGGTGVGAVAAAGAVAVAGGWGREGKWPKNGTTALVATAVLMVIVSGASKTPAAPVVKSLAYLLLLASIIKSVPALNTERAKSAKKGATRG